MTYENILKRVLERVPRDIDKRQGSVIYDAVAPACAELAEAYIKMENAVDNSFADTACREYLIMRARERGIEPFEATKAIARGVFDGQVKIGSRFNIGIVNFKVIEKITDYEYKMECETAGVVGNNYFGTLIPVDYTPGVGRSELTEILIPGRDEEDTENFRERYFESLYGDDFGGNKADYKKWVKAIDGVGQVRVKRAGSNNADVKVIILGADGKGPSAALIKSVKENLDPAAKSGQGEGIAPIGHFVTVMGASVDNKYINIYADFESNADHNYINNITQNILEEYFDELNREWENTENGIELHSAQIIVKLLGVKGIKNIRSVDIDGKTSITLSEDKILGLDNFDFLGD